MRRSIRASPWRDSSASGVVEAKLALVEKERKSKRHADDADRGDRHPEPPQAEAAPFHDHEAADDERAEQDVETEEAADTVREQIGDEAAAVETVLRNPRIEWRVGNENADHREGEIEVSHLHRGLLRERRFYSNRLDAAHE